MNSNRITKIMIIVTALQSGRRFTVDDLAKMLDLSRRTIFRYLKELSAVGISCRYDAKNKTYVIDGGCLLTPPDLTLQEALGLLIVLQKAANHIYLPFNDSALSAALKIESSLPSKTRQFCNAVLQNIYVKSRPQARKGRLDKIFAIMQEAILKSRWVNIQYYLPLERRNIQTDLAPYHMMHSDDKWYVLGLSCFHKGVSTLRISQIKELRMLDKCFAEERKFDLHEYLGRAWSMTPEGRLHLVKLRFTPEAAYDVASVRWHDTQTVTQNEDGSAIVEFRVDGLKEIARWILGYGDKVEVLAPASLRKQIAQIARSMLTVNSDVQKVIEIAKVKPNHSNSPVGRKVN
jgi:predicted DNA-binding transcriptional regulator YafY